MLSNWVWRYEVGVISRDYYGYIEVASVSRTRGDVVEYAKASRTKPVDDVLGWPKRGVYEWWLTETRGELPWRARRALERLYRRDRRRIDRAAEQRARNSPWRARQALPEAKVVAESTRRSTDR